MEGEMANRTMQAKALKLQRQLRKLPRRIDNPPGEFTKHSGTEMPVRLKAEGVSAPRSPNRELMDGYKHRAKSLSMSEVVARFSGIPPGRLEAIERAVKMRNEEIDPNIEKLLRYVKCRLTRG
jgi:hypothetical protein